MNRKEIIEILKDMAGPLGPFTRIESMEDLINLRSNRYQSIDINALDILIDIILNPPGEKELGHISSEDIELELVEMLTIIGRRDVTDFLSRTKKLLYLDQTRTVMIDVLGGLCQEESLLLLESLLSEHLNEEEIIGLIDAVSTHSGLKAKELLEKIKIKYSNYSEKVSEEINICLSQLK